MKDKPVLYALYSGVVCLLIGLVVWPFIGWIFALARHTPFVWTASAYLYGPLSFACVYAVMIYTGSRNRK